MLASVLVRGMCWAGAGAACRLPSALQRENRSGLQGSGGSSREEVGRAFLPPPCCWTSLGKSLCPVALLLPARFCLAWQVFTSRLQVSYVWVYS